jgi:hypothetical protein
VRQGRKSCGCCAEGGSRPVVESRRPGMAARSGDSLRAGHPRRPPTSPDGHCRPARNRHHRRRQPLTATRVQAGDDAGLDRAPTVTAPTTGPPSPSAPEATADPNGNGLPYGWAHRLLATALWTAREQGPYRCADRTPNAAGVDPGRGGEVGGRGSPPDRQGRIRPGAGTRFAPGGPLPPQAAGTGRKCVACDCWASSP